MYYVCCEIPNRLVGVTTLKKINEANDFDLRRIAMEVYVVF